MSQPKFDDYGQPVVQRDGQRLFHYAQDGKTKVPVAVPDGHKIVDAENTAGWEIVPKDPEEFAGPEATVAESRETAEDTEKVEKAARDAARKSVGGKQ